MVVPFVDDKKFYGYANELVSCLCNRCGKQTQLSPKVLLEAYDMRVPICTNCGEKSDEEVRAYKQEMRNNAGLDAMRRAASDTSTESANVLQDEPAPQQQQQQDSDVAPPSQKVETITHTQDELADLLATDDDLSPLPDPVAESIIIINKIVLISDKIIRRIQCL